MILKLKRKDTVSQASAMFKHVLIKLFDSIVNNNSHKLIDLLPLKVNSYSSRLRKKRYFHLPNLKPNRTRNSFVFSCADRDYN